MLQREFFGNKFEVEKFPKKLRQSLQLKNFQDKNHLNKTHVFFIAKNHNAKIFTQKPILTTLTPNNFQSNRNNSRPGKLHRRVRFKLANSN
jgi:hypothetical protein